MMSIPTMTSKLYKLVTDNSPSILAAFAVSGIFTTVVLAVRATPKAVEDIKYVEISGGSILTPKETVELVWRHYIPTVAVGLATVTCVIGSVAVNNRRNAALISVYSLTESAFKEYKDKIAHELGPRKEQKITDAIVQDRVQRNPGNSSEVIIVDASDILCYDTLTGRYFKSTVDKIKKAQNDLNSQMIKSTYASLNDFYDLLGLGRTSYGEEVGWTVDNLLDLNFTSVLSEDQRPCLALNYRFMPVRNYYKNN